jgi:outer membrane autotransporter protein
LSGQFSGYDTSSRYYSLHAGLGAIRKLTSKSYIDLYGKYFYTRQNGESMTLATGDPVRFDDADSSRLRLGMRYGYKKSDRVEYYLGAAWEHEFDGRVNASAYDLPINAPSIKGDTAIMELGVKVTPSKTKHTSIDIGLQGYAGKREGITASARFNWLF